MMCPSGHRCHDCTSKARGSCLGEAVGKWGREIHGNPFLAAQFFCDSKTTLKTSVLISHPLLSSRKGFMSSPVPPWHSPSPPLPLHFLLPPWLSGSLLLSFKYEHYRPGLAKGPAPLLRASPLSPDPLDPSALSVRPGRLP